MKIKTILLFSVLCVLCASCGSDDEPQMAQGTLMDENHGKTVLAGTDIYLDSEHRLITPSKQYSISLCTANELSGIEAQQVKMSLNWRMKIAEGNVYAIAQVDRIRNFKSGAFALELGAPLTYIKVTELIKDGNEVTGFHYETVSGTAERGNLPGWDTTYKFQKMDEDSWNTTLPLTYGAYEIATFDNDYLLSTTNAERNYINVEISHRWVREDHSNDYEQRLLVTYTLDSHIYIRYGSVCTRAIVKQQ
ncbi:MAG: DUF5036 family protein [Muribaculaceae bacterium]|nr:DUF5036 family protein [Muribaculaceae bacterium]